MAVSEDHASCWVHKDLTVTTKKNQALLTTARASGGKEKCQIRLTGVEREYWMGTEIGRLEGCGFQGKITAGDGSNQKGRKKRNLQRKRKRQQRKVGRKEGGSSSNRSKLASFVFALHGNPVSNPMLYLCDNQALLKAVKRWVGKGGKVTLVRAPDADILREAIKQLPKKKQQEQQCFWSK